MAGKVKKPTGKRASGEGTFRERDNGRVWWQICVTLPSGKRRRPSGTARNWTEARAAAREARRAAEADMLPSRERLTVAELVSEYIEAGAASDKQKTQSNKRGLLRLYVSPSLGHLKAQGLSPKELREFWAALGVERGLSDSTVRQVFNLINGAYKLALNDGRVTSNPCTRARPVRLGAKGAPRLKTYTPDEAARLYKAARYDRWGWPLAFMLATGLRQGEALALTWEHVTFNPDGSATVKVEGTRSLMEGRPYEDTPKTERGRRSLTVTGDAVGILRDSRAQTQREARARLRHNGREYEKTNYVFTTRAGTPYYPGNLRVPLRRLCEAAGVPVLNIHALRHTFTSVLAATGAPVEVLSAHLGHSKASVTRDIYRHVFDSERRGLTYDPITGSAEAGAE